MIAMERVPLNVRIDRDLRENLQEIAREQNRTLSNLVETALLQVVAATGRDARTPPKNRRG
jgi:predicted transcriptional regulator